MGKQIIITSQNPTTGDTRVNVHEAAQYITPLVHLSSDNVATVYEDTVPVLVVTHVLSIQRKEVP